MTSHSLAITPGGRLQLVEAADEGAPLAEATSKQLAAAFNECTAAGLALLASSKLGEALPAQFNFWRSFAQRYFQGVCHLGEGAASRWKSVSPPDDQRLEELVAFAPSMRGLDYLDASLLSRLWGELADFVSAKAQSFPGGPAAYGGSS